MKKGLTVDELIAAKQIMEQRIARVASEEVAAFAKKTGACVDDVRVNLTEVRVLEKAGVKRHTAVTGVEASIFLN